jgi:hypothetical protein
MDQLGEDNRLPFINVHEGDIGVLLGFPLGGLFIGSWLGIDLLAIGLLAIGFMLGVAIVYAAPSDLTAWEWLTDVGRYLLRRPRVTHSTRPDESV